MGKDKVGMTSALRMLKAEKVDFIPYTYRYEEKGGSATASRELGIDEHLVIKTLVFESEKKEPVLVLMHGDKHVSVKELARSAGVKTMLPCDPQIANKHTGYMVGGISPFGTKKKMQVFAEASIFDLPEIYINAGRRGLLVKLNPMELQRVLEAKPVSVSI